MSLDSGKTGSGVEVILFDAMHTVVEPLIPRFFHILAIFEEVLGIRIHPQRLAHCLREAQRLIGPTPDFKQDWIKWNSQIIAWLLEKPLEEVDPVLGERVHKKIIADVNSYEVKPAMRNLLYLLSSLRILQRERPREVIPVDREDNASIQARVEIYEPPKLVLVSNQYRDRLEAIVDKLKLREFFGSRVISSDQLGCAKPDPQFFVRVRDWLSLEREQVVVVGNSLARDLPSALADQLPLCLYDRRSKLVLPPAVEVDGQWTQVKETTIVRTVAELQDWLLSRLIPGYSWAEKPQPPSLLV